MPSWIEYESETYSSGKTIFHYKEKKDATGSAEKNRIEEKERELLSYFKELYKNNFRQEYIVKSNDYFLASELIQKIGTSECKICLKRTFSKNYWFGVCEACSKFTKHINEFIDTAPYSHAHPLQDEEPPSPRDLEYSRRMARKLVKALSEDNGKLSINQSK